MQEQSACLVWGCITRFTRMRLRMFGLRVLLSLQSQIFLREETERMVGEERIGVKKGACGYEAEQRVAQEKATATPWREVIGALFKRIAT